MEGRGLRWSATPLGMVSAPVKPLQLIEGSDTDGFEIGGQGQLTIEAAEAVADARRNGERAAEGAIPEGGGRWFGG